MGWDEFLSLCRENGYSSEDIAKFLDATAVAGDALQEKKRLSGESYLNHNLRVAAILVENKASPEVVLAGVLRNVPGEQVRKRFGAEVASLAEGVEEVTLIRSKNKRLEAEALRRILLTTLKDVRIIILKLATKLDNLRTLDALPAEEQKRIASEALEIYAPLAGRLGLENIRVALEDAAFQVLSPRKYQEIAHFLNETQEEREKEVAKAIELIRQCCRESVPEMKIKGRSKHIYSIYRKMTVRGVSLAEQYDLLGIRIIVPEVKDCYTVLGLLHEHFEPVPDRLKDYITHPKPNLYRSLHTAVNLPTGKTAEVQIRTPEMDEFAEEGIAAHWRYKGLRSEEIFEKKVAWLREVLNLKQEEKELLETAKVDLFGDTIYCYTPKGDVKELPTGATVLDFAYAVHEEVGNHTVGARVNGIFVPLRQELQQGDVVDVMTNKSQRPRRSWLKIVISGKSKQKIRKSLKEHEKLAPIHFHPLKQVVTEEQGVLTESPEFPKAWCTLAKCCNPLPGEDIVGLATKRRLISVHRRDCRLALKEEERWVKVQWKKSFSQKIRYSVLAEERSGLLADLLHTTVQAGFEVKEAKAKLVDKDLAECSFLLVPRELEQVQELVRRLRKIRGVKKVYFE